MTCVLLNSCVSPRGHLSLDLGPARPQDHRPPRDPEDLSPTCRDACPVSGHTGSRAQGVGVPSRSPLGSLHRPDDVTSGREEPGVTADPGRGPGPPLSPADHGRRQSVSPLLHGPLHPTPVTTTGRALCSAPGRDQVCSGPPGNRAPTAAPLPGLPHAPPLRTSLLSFKGPLRQPVQACGQCDRPWGGAGCGSCDHCLLEAPRAPTPLNRLQALRSEWGFKTRIPPAAAAPPASGASADTCSESDLGRGPGDSGPPAPQATQRALHAAAP